MPKQSLPIFLIGIFAFILLIHSPIYSQEVKNDICCIPTETIQKNPYLPDKVNDGRIIWKTSSGYDLDQYCGPLCSCSKSMLKFPIMIDTAVQDLKNVKLTLSVWDVDEAQGEVDIVSLNGRVLGTLHGANNSWSVNNYTLDPSILVGGTKASPGENEVIVYVDINRAGWCVTIDWGAVSADGGEFDVVEFYPGTAKLTDYKNPDLRLTFNDEVDLSTVTNQTVVLRYVGTGGSYVEVNKNVTYGSSKEVLILKPTSNLIDGIKYSIMVVGGNNGVKSLKQATLKSSRFFEFGTVPDLEIDKAKLTPIQVVRNKKQIRNKETIFRVYTKWDIKANVDPSAQYEKVDVKVKLKDERGAEFLSKSMQVERKDLREKEERKKAGTNSLNIYTFYPVLTDGNHAIEVELEPEGQVGNNPVKFSEKTDISIAPHSKTLKINYHFLLLDKWKSGVPQADRTRMENLMNRCKTFFRDNFPVTDIEMNKGADIDFTNPLSKYSWPHARSVPVALRSKLTPYLDTVNNIIRNTTYWKDKGADVAFVGLIPQDFGKRSLDSGWTWDETSFTGVSCSFSDGTKLILLRDDEGVAGSGANATTVPHEFGHNYGLSTKKFDGTAHTTNQMPTDGFWVTQKKNKSSTEGNTDSNNPMVSLMSKYIRPEVDGWICDYDYNELFDNVAMKKIVSKPSATGPHLFISGGYDLNNNLYLLPIWESDYEATSYPNQGDLTLSLLTSTNTEIASYKFQSFSLRNLDGWEDTIKAFSIVVPTPSNLGKIRILSGSTILKEIIKTPNKPVINITNPTSGATWSGSSTRTISWTASDVDGDKLIYRVSYSSDNGNTWESISANIDQTSVNIIGSQLESGQQCKIKVSATDGLNTTHQEVTFKVNNGLTIGLYNPPNNSTNIPTTTSIEAIFDTYVPISQITSGKMTLKEYSSGAAVSGTVKYFTSSRTIRFIPDKDLKYNTKYQVTIVSGITDTLGNVLSSNFVWTFTTIENQSSLNIEETYPYGSAVNVPINSKIVVAFNKSLTSSSVTTSSFVVTENQTGATVPGSVSYNSSNWTATFTPTSNLKFETLYKVKLTTAIKSTDNKSLSADYVFYFLTGNETPTGVKFTGRYSDEGLDTDGDSKYDWLVIKIDVNLVNSGSYAINGKLADSKNNELVWASASTSLSAGISTVELRFDGKVINAYQTNGPYKLMDLQIYNTSNTDISDWVSYAYSTKSYSYTDFQLSNIPVAIDLYPQDGATHVPEDVKITATFTRSMKASTINSSTFYLTGNNNVKVKSTVTYDPITRKATLTPDSSLKVDSFYTATLTTSIQDSAGTNLLKQYNWSFTVGVVQAAGDISSIVSYPNPFPHPSLPTGGMRFTYILGESGGKVSIKIYNIAGDFVKEISDASAKKGYNETDWDGRDKDNNLVASGTYIYIIQYTKADGTEIKEIKKFTVIR